MRRPRTHLTQAWVSVPRASTRLRGGRWVMVLGFVALMVPTVGHSHPKPTISPTKRGELMYEIKAGDAVERIARRFGVSSRALLEANGLERPDLVRPGQLLVIPSGRVSAATGGRAKSGAHVPANFVLAVPDFALRAPRFRWPLEGPISSPFGRRRNGWHAGIDIKAEVGTPVLSAAGGTVLFSGWEKLYGRVVKIAHDDGFMTVYAHNLQNFVKGGEAVEAGQVIAAVGRTGRASAHHLHFEIRNEGKVFNPVFLLPARELRYEPTLETAAEDDEGA